MTTKKLPQKKSSKSKKLPNTPITVALIGLIGVIITAVFSLVGILFVNRQTSSLNASNTPTSELDWSQLIGLGDYGGGCAGQAVQRVVPNYISLRENDPNSYNAVKDLIDLPISPLPITYPEYGDDGSIPWVISITNLSSNIGDWLQAENTLTIKVQVLSSDIEEHVDLWRIAGGGCGGYDKERFSPVALNQRPSSAVQIVESQNFDYFSFEPGETGVFQLDIYCQSPGSYQLSAETKMKYKNKTETVILINNRKFFCPKTYSLWITNFSYLTQLEFNKQDGSPITASPMTHVSDWYWDGESYIIDE